ncbi:LPP20 family lipoprotein [Helicobacter sp. 11S03491-1]|uniref:LPP20 family lipoprotein n=1 Tax=Helicobacter sp. 11S03491-1 TaxID=1476196 RepID=UPI000BA5F8E0|nr:LPP20 family lipoprotein [Helicobacter sp. 11S03491-1]PAF42209.1 hypothetical protein BKH45_04495 [Helicobacter sp. 11S03491-1]
MGKNIVFLCGVLFLSGCFSATQVSTPPQWFLDIPKDKTYLYGNGNAKTLEESKKSALNDLASKIKIKISSDTSITNTQDNDNQNTQVSQNIHLSLDTIELENVILVHSEYKNKQYYAQIKISKSTLSQTLQNKYKALYAKLPSLDPQKCSSISLKDKNTLESLINELTSLSQSIKVLNPLIQIQSLQRYEDIFKQNTPLAKARIIFSPQSDAQSVAILNGEYAKFIKNTHENNTHTIYNQVFIKTQENKIEISLLADFRDCQDKTIFYINIHAIQNNKEDALNRLKVLLYKKLQDYANDQENAIPGIY